MVLGSIPKIGTVCMMLCHNTLALNGSTFIDPGNFPRVFLKIVCGPYTHQTYLFACPTVLRKFVVMVTIGRAYLILVIDKLLYTKGSEGDGNWNLCDHRSLILILVLRCD